MTNYTRNIWMLKSILAHAFLFFYIYSVQFKVGSGAIGSRVLLGLLGFILMIYILLKEKNLMVNKNIIKVLTLLVLIVMASVSSLLINGTNDLTFIKYPISMIVIMFACYFVNWVMSKCNKNIDFKCVATTIINVVCIQILLSILLFLLPDLKEFVFNIQYFTDYELNIIRDTFDFRLVGCGSFFFGAAIVNGFAIILVSLIIRNYKLNTHELISIGVKYFIIFVFGMMMARATLIGFGLSIIILFLPSITKLKIHFYKQSLLFILITFILPMFLLVFLYKYDPSYFAKIDPLISFGFEMLKNYFDSGELSTNSTDELKNMYVFPAHISTYILGDGLFNNPDGFGYYQGIDVGFLRLTYYFGIVGLLIYLFLQGTLLYFAKKVCYTSAVFFGVLFLYLLCLNLKGFTDLGFLVMLFFIKYSVSYKSTQQCPVRKLH